MGGAHGFCGFVPLPLNASSGNHESGQVMQYHECVHGAQPQREFNSVFRISAVFAELGAPRGDKFTPGNEHGKGRPAAACSAHCSDNRDMSGSSPWGEMSTPSIMKWRKANRPGQQRQRWQPSRGLERWVAPRGLTCSRTIPSRLYRDISCVLAWKRRAVRPSRF